ncbi:MAG: hypothetical protein CMJ49_00425 [Planctomycetaceae bacterium]|nr:hypothetical protein [Planctomycetaceae bacterium]
MYELGLLDRDAPLPAGPNASVTSIRCVARDGWYNAFTDLVKWRDYYWLSYRRGTCHHADHGVIVVLRSNDFRRWHEIAVFDRPQGFSGAYDSGVQDGHFTDAGDRLYLSINTRVPTDCFMAWTEDGNHWSEPKAMRMGSEVEPFIWRVRWHEGMFYSAVSYDLERAPLELIVSEDGVTWRKHAQIAGTEAHDWSSESDLLFRADGELWCVVRSEWPAIFFRAEPPYVDWDGGDTTGHGIGLCDAPAMCEVDGEVFVAGRIEAPRFLGDYPLGYPQGTTGLYHLWKDGGRPLIALPIGGDASYAGLVSPEPGRLVMSYYSDVAYWSGALPTQSTPHFEYKRSDCDIYLAEIEVTM